MRFYASLANGREQAAQLPSLRPAEAMRFEYDAQPFDFELAVPHAVQNIL